MNSASELVCQGPQARGHETSAHPQLKGPQKFVDCESMSPTQGATQFVDRLAWIGVRPSREGVKNGHGWGMGPKRCLHMLGTLTLPPSLPPPPWLPLHLIRLHSQAGLVPFSPLRPVLLLPSHGPTPRRYTATPYCNASLQLSAASLYHDFIPPSTLWRTPPPERATVQSPPTPRANCHRPHSPLPSGGGRGNMHEDPH